MTLPDGAQYELMKYKTMRRLHIHHFQLFDNQ